MQRKFIVSRYNEDYMWIRQYTDNYVVYNKGEYIHNGYVENGYIKYGNVLNVENVGANQRDICMFIVDNYDNLPDIMIFIQATPWDHCKVETFDKLIQNETFVSLEDYSHLPPQGNGYRIIDGYEEINTSWYIPAHNSTYGLTCRYNSYDEFMYKYFIDYVHIDWIRFCPGSQYLVPKENILKYPKKFWESMMNELVGSPRPTEGHIVERSLLYIFSNVYTIKEEYI